MKGRLFNLQKIVCLSLLLFCSQYSAAEKIRVAVASNFAAPMEEIVTAFEARSGHQVEMSFGSSGKFYAQIKHGAPFQAFFSADEDKPRALEKERLSVPGSRFTYAIGSIVLWSLHENLHVEGGSVLQQGGVNKLALANPKLAPYGKAAVEVLQNLDLLKKTQSKWVQGENIAQAYQFVSTGNADLGFVALSQVLDKGDIKTGAAWIVPHQLHSPIKQDAVLLVNGESSQASRELLQFMKSDTARTIIESYGYRTADGRK